MTSPSGDAPEPAPTPPRPARRHYLTVLFADLSGSTRLAATMEAEQYGAMLAAVRDAYRTVVPKHGGTVARIQGDGVLAIFGHPEAREDDGRRASEAALDLHETVRGLRLALPDSALLRLHSGIHAGLVLLDEGDAMRGRFELIGNVPNIAARLSTAAGPDEILVSEETLGAESHFFETSERRLIDLRGAPEPVAVYRLFARAQVGTRLEARARRGLAPFVGRQRELEILDAALHETLAGRPCCVAVSAGAGLGKTRLVEEFLRRAAALDCQIRRGYCESYLGAEPLQPFLQMLRSLFGLDYGTPAARAAEAVDRKLADIDPALLSHRAEFLRALSVSDPDSADARRPAPEGTVRALRDLFAGLAAKQPLLLVLDDWQWADDASSQVLTAIRARDRSAIFVLIATRGFAAGGAGIGDARIVELAPFTDDEAAQTVEQLLPRTDPFLLGEIRRYAGGNPLFIEELCHSAAHDARRLARMHGAAWLNTLIESRVARLPAAQAELVRSAAVIGNVIPAWLLHSLTGCAEDHPLVRGLAEQDFVFPGEQAGTLRFKHGITRDVIYESVGLHPRQAMHRRIAESLLQRGPSGAQEEVYEALAYHFGAGGQVADAARFAELAGDKAVAASALDRAKSQYRAALAALDRLGAAQTNYLLWTSISQRLGLACVFDAARDELLVFRRAVELATMSGDQAATARAQYWLGYINYALGEYHDALHHGELALAAASAVGDDPLAVQVRATLGQVHAAASNYDAAMPLLDEAIAIKRSHRTGARPAVGLAYSLACKAQVLGDRGEFARAQQCVDEALEAVRGATHEVQASIRGWRGALLLWQGRWEEALQSADESYRIAERVRSLFSLSMSRAIGAYAGWMLERRPESLQAIADATAWLEPRDGGLFRSLNHGWLADGMAASGRFSEARHHAARALLRARKSDLIGVAMAYRALARVAAGEGDGPRARHYLALAMKTAQARQSAHEAAVTQLCEAEIELVLGDRSRAAGPLDAAAAAFEAMDMRWHLEQAARLRRSL